MIPPAGAACPLWPDSGRVLDIGAPHHGSGIICAGEIDLVNLTTVTKGLQVKSRVALEADEVQAALEAAKTEAVKNGWVVSIAVVDDGGHALGFLRLTDAAPLSAQIAFGKARTAAVGRRESKFFEEVIKNGRTAFLSVSDLTTLEGGVPVIVGGQCVGAIGVSGVRSDQDAQIASAGVQAILQKQ